MIFTDTGSAPPIQPAGYRPLDPAIDSVGDTRSKHAKIPTRSSASAARGDGNAGRGAGRADSAAHVIALPTALSNARRLVQPNVNNTLSDPAAFMRAVAQMNAGKITTTSTKFEAVKPSPNTSTKNIDSKWGDPPLAKPVVAKPMAAKPVTAGKTAKATSLPSTVTTSKIRQVPTNEFALPHPHHGDTDSWTDGIQSARLSALDSPVPSSGAASTQPFPAVIQDTTNGVGLGIQGMDTSVEEYVKTNGSNTANGIDLMDITEDLSALEETPLSRAQLARRIIVHGAVYVLDESALGNAAASVIEEEPKEVSNTTSDTSSIVGNRNVAMGSGTQTTPSLTQSQGNVVPSTFQPLVNNPFANGTAPRPPPVPRPSSDEFATIVRPQPEELVSSFLTELTSPGGVSSAISTPSLSTKFSSSISSRPAAKVISCTSAVPVQYTAPSAATTFQAVNRDVAMMDAVGGSRPSVIDPFQLDRLVRLQQVGDASFGMIPFAGPTQTRPTPARQGSTAISVTSAAVSSSVPGRGLTACRFAIQDTEAPRETMPALQSLPLNRQNPCGEADYLPKAPPYRSAFGTGSNVSRYATQDENVPPRQRTTTSTFGNGSGPQSPPKVATDPAGCAIERGDHIRARHGSTYDVPRKSRPIAREPTLIRRTPTSPGFALPQVDLAALGKENPGSAVLFPTAPAQGAEMQFSSTSSITRPTAEDDGYESEL